MIIGLTLSLTTPVEFTTLFIVIIFHRMSLSTPSNLTRSC